RTADPLESGGLVDRDHVLVTEDGQLVLPLTQTSTRRAEVTFYLRRSVPRDARRLKLPLPIPVAESIATGDLVVHAAPGIELVPDTAGCKGLTPTPVTEMQAANANDTAVEYRFRCFLPDAIFAADRTNRPRDVAVDVAAQVNLRQQPVDVRERVEYNV